MITDRPSSTKMPPTIGSSSSLLDEDRDRAERAAQRERADVAHEDLGGIAVVPKEAETGSDECTAKIVSSLVGGNRISKRLGKLCVAGHIGQRGERRRDRKHADREPIEPSVMLTPLLAKTKHEHRKHDIEPTEIGNQVLKNGKISRVL